MPVFNENITASQSARDAASRIARNRQTGSIGTFFRRTLYVSALSAAFLIAAPEKGMAQYEDGSSFYQSPLGYRKFELAAIIMDAKAEYYNLDLRRKFNIPDFDKPGDALRKARYLIVNYEYWLAKDLNDYYADPTGFQLRRTDGELEQVRELQKCFNDPAGYSSENPGLFQVRHSGKWGSNGEIEPVEVRDAKAMKKHARLAKITAAKTAERDRQNKTWGELSDEEKGVLDRERWMQEHSGNFSNTALQRYCNREGHLPNMTTFNPKSEFKPRTSPNYRFSEREVREARNQMKRMEEDYEQQQRVEAENKKPDIDFAKPNPGSGGGSSFGIGKILLYVGGFFVAIWAFGSLFGGGSGSSSGTQASAARTASPPAPAPVPPKIAETASAPVTDEKPRAARQKRIVAKKTMEVSDMDDYETWKAKRLKKWDDYKLKYKAEIVDLVRKTVDVSDYYYYKARCAATLEETMKLMDEVMDERLEPTDNRLAELAEKNPEDMPKELVRELGFGGVKIPKLRRMHGTHTPHAADKSPEAYIERATRVRENVTTEDKEIFEKLKKYVTEVYGGEP